MEITRHTKTGYSIPAETVATQRPDSAPKTAGTASSAPMLTSSEPAPEPRLDQLQEAMRKLPEVDLEQVAAIKQAIARGELSSDVRVLAQSILAYHRGSDL